MSNIYFCVIIEVLYIFMLLFQHYSRIFSYFMTSQFMQMNVNISESAARRLDCGFTAHARNICPRTPWSLIQTRLMLSQNCVVLFSPRHTTGQAVNQSVRGVAGQCHGVILTFCHLTLLTYKILFGQSLKSIRCRIFILGRDITWKVWLCNITV